MRLGSLIYKKLKFMKKLTILTIFSLATLANAQSFTTANYGVEEFEAESFFELNPNSYDNVFILTSVAIKRMRTV